MVYHKSYEQDDRELLLCPYCTRVFKQRWYVCGVIKEVEQERLRCYALDRVAAMDLTDIPFILPEDFDAATYFLDCYGIFDDEEPTDIYLKISALQRPWVRSLPIHSSQKIIKETDDFDIIRLHVRPCYDFLQQILTYGAQVQILKPDWLRYYFIADILEMTDLYHDIDDHLAEYEQYISESPEER